MRLRINASPAQAETCARWEDQILQCPGLLCALARACEYDGGKLADHLDVSRRHLQRIFAAKLGRSPQEWLKEQRLERARSMLSTARSVKEVAHGLGFRHVSQFSRDFRLRFGVNPSVLLSVTAAA